jgi:ribonuclease P protein subunit RPR2
MSKKRAEQKKLYKNIASHRIRYLFSLAEQNALNDKLLLSNRYVALARKISMKYLVPIPREYKRRFCTHCYSYLLPSVNCRVRIHRGMIVIFCSTCKKYNRIPLHDRSGTP